MGLVLQSSLSPSFWGFAYSLSFNGNLAGWRALLQLVVSLYASYGPLTAASIPEHLTRWPRVVLVFPSIPGTFAIIVICT